MKIELEINNSYYLDTIQEIAQATGSTEEIVCMGMVRQNVIRYRRAMSEARAESIKYACGNFKDYEEENE